MIKIILLFGLLVTLSACTSQEVNTFQECVNAGYPVMESHPRQCSDGTTTFTENVEEKLYVSMSPEECTLIKFTCEEGRVPFFDEQGCGCKTLNTGICPAVYDPVCASIQVQCVTTPCDPMDVTFGNSCEASNAGATNIRPGECQQEINLEGSCLSFDGTWIAQTQECEYMPSEMCEELGGTFDECASACRNNPEAEMCTMQCVPVCQF